MRKMYIAVVLLFAGLGLVNAQALYNAGTITIQSNGTTDGLLYVNGDVEITSTGAVENNGVFEIKGDYDNNRTDGAITYNGTGAGLTKFTAGVGILQELNTSSANGELSFQNVELTNQLLYTGNTPTAGVRTYDNIRINGELSFNGGGIAMMDKDLILGLDATSTGYTATHNAQFTSGAFVKKISNAQPATTHFFPYYKIDGNIYYGDDYLPVEMQINTSPVQADEVRVKFIPNNDLGNVFHVGGCNNQNIMLNQLVERFGYWEIDVEDASNNNLDNTAGWYYDLTLFPPAGALSYLSSTYGSDYYKILRIPSHVGNSQITFNPATADWSSYVTQSGTYCNGITEIATYDPNVGITAYALNNFSRFGGAGNSGGAGLPIELVSIDANGIDDEYIAVTWTTAVEIDNAGFEVMRSTNGRDFEHIGWVDGKGTTTEYVDYVFNDVKVQPNVIYYYKLNQVDFDGANKETPMVSASISADEVMVIGDFIPNPTLDNTHLIITSPKAQELQLTVYNTLGQIVLYTEQEMTPGNNRVDLSMGGVADGTYHAVLMIDGKVHNKKLVVTK